MGYMLDPMLERLPQDVKECCEDNRRALLDELHALLQQTEPEDLTMTEILALLAVLTPVAARHKGAPAPAVTVETNVIPDDTATQLE
ncbi:hypothetical protein MNVI_41100 [Mycobacterium noviomagense]|uniref:Uncharacterized protein n=1 Tax=Mycobacterium noviomagense TaxID=459858 RepID=A0A7I7PJU3_9MYCO|nr:hypothetical protein MNVI_41100 [Mycobacterium noviomagense]